MDKLDELHKIFSNVNDWLKFAEAKNALLVGVISTLLLFAFPNISNLHQDLQIIVRFVIIPVEVIALIISFVSFFPWYKKSDKINIFYFEHLKMKNNKDLYNRFETQEDNSKDLLIQEICNDLIEQIITNSKITSLKIRLFNYGGLIFLIGIILTSLIYIFKLN